jgi:hypothetical protein
MNGLAAPLATRTRWFKLSLRLLRSGG